jgi:hypothetical protein
VDFERGPSATALAGRTGHAVCRQVDAEAVLGEAPRGVAHRGHLGYYLEARIASALRVAPSVGIGRVAEDLGLVLQALEEVVNLRCTVFQLVELVEDTDAGSAPDSGGRYAEC